MINCITKTMKMLSSVLTNINPLYSVCCTLTTFIPQVTALMACNPLIDNPTQNSLGFLDDRSPGEHLTNV